MSSDAEGAALKSLAELGLTALRPFSKPLSGLFIDSRLVQEGGLFIALPGTQSHGAEFAAQAIENGAAAVLTDQDGHALMRQSLAEISVAMVVVEDPAAALASAAALWFEAQPQKIVAVTGTNGKTSVTHFCRQIWTELDCQAINLGTNGVQGAFTAPLSHTTPDALLLQSLLAKAALAGVTHAAIEASSHGLQQRRLDGVKLCAAGFTNFTQDHLDYHKDFEDYFSAKTGLFDRLLLQDQPAVLNIDDPKLAELAARLEQSDQAMITIGHCPEADIRIDNLRFTATGQDMRFTYQEIPRLVSLPLRGKFQAENVLMAAALVIAAGAKPASVFETLEHLTTVRGRMELAAQRENGALVFVDYAHTPDALEKAISALRPHVLGRLVAVIGAGGDRDPFKRPLMGAAAAGAADFVFVTDDNPRSEDPSEIRKMVISGMSEPAQVKEVGDRAEAILRAVDMLKPGDALLIAGKGHETGQVIGDDILPFDDVEQASLAVAALDGGLV